MDKLEELHLTSNSLSGNLPFLSSLPLMTIIHLADNDLSGLLPTEIGSFESLLSLNVANNSQLEGSIPAEYGNLVNLENFELEGTQIQGEMPGSICELSKLEYVSVECSNIDCDCCVCVEDEDEEDESVEDEDEEDESVEI